MSNKQTEALKPIREALADQQAHEEIERAMSQVWQDVPGAVNFGVDPKPAQHRAWFTVDELNAWADKKLKENPQWVEQPAQQQGWKLVPVQPTDEMRDAGNAIIGDRGALFAAYRAMLNAAPQPAQQEPVITKNEKGLTLHVGWDDLPAGTKLYTSSLASKPWVGLTDEERDAILDREFKQWWSRHDAVCRAIEAKLKEKNT